jgi:hypothetical protein
MPDIPSTLAILNKLWSLAAKAEADRQEIMQSNLPQYMKDDQDKIIQQQVAQLHGHQDKLLDELVHFPPHTVEHFANVKQFHQASPYEKSVFVMTKFPANSAPVDTQLAKVIKAVRDAVTKAGFFAHVASDKTYNPLLWKNVEFYLLACSRGIAIVESKHTAELNPNVTMEWGWMRGMDRPVLFLVEQSFDKNRADLSGLINDPFDWDNPEPGIEAAVNKFLT